MPQIESLEQKKLTLQTTNEDYQKYLDKGMPLLKNIGKAFMEADYNEKQNLVGSIFKEKLIFEENNYRTIEPNPILSLIDKSGKGLGLFKNKNGRISYDHSCRVVPPRIELGSKV